MKQPLSQTFCNEYVSLFIYRVLRQVGRGRFTAIRAANEADKATMGNKREWIVDSRLFNRRSVMIYYAHGVSNLMNGRLTNLVGITVAFRTA
ncbi:hypothetical protein [Paenibacillus oleatilyticus]|uniref:Uncharacterized protein n=1 Tax=Paenibacillus oleatilyticus TaxID=2594886 RepID=A0ABV4V5I7_9BACL